MTRHAIELLVGVFIVLALFCCAVWGEGCRVRACLVVWLRERQSHRER
jgi:hypothetical protein